MTGVTFPGAGDVPTRIEARGKKAEPTCGARLWKSAVVAQPGHWKRVSNRSRSHKRSGTQELDVFIERISRDYKLWFVALPAWENEAVYRRGNGGKPMRSRQIA